MRRAAVAWEVFLGVLLLIGRGGLCDQSASSGHETPSTSSATPSTEVCPAKTINYITHTLPQQCLRTPWTSPSPSSDPNPEAHLASTETENPTHSADAAVQNITHSEQLADQREAGDKKEDAAKRDEEDAQDLATSSFMSFEEWKEMMLQKADQEQKDQNELRLQKQREAKGDPLADASNGDLDGFGDDGEISKEFDALADKISELASPDTGGGGEKSQASKGATEEQEQVVVDDGKNQYVRSKDAGKTCKERFSYSSFDAGATVLKTSPGAKNAKHLLVENKDSYMLLECATPNKFVIVELSDDILVDTVVLANFEFFSSMIRRFRVSVSDRYPAKPDKWIELGIFEARNSRDIQPFLVEHPQIYTKYIRIEFLSHYGNEYYCPVSLLRIHGTRMLDSWKEPEEETEAIDPPPVVEQIPEAPTTQAEPAPETPTGGTNTTNYMIVHDELVTELGLSLWPFVFNLDEVLSDTCPQDSEPSTTGPTQVSGPPLEGTDVSVSSTTTKPAVSTEPPLSTVDNSNTKDAVRTSVTLTTGISSDSIISSSSTIANISSTPSPVVPTPAESSPGNMTQTSSSRTNTTEPAVPSSPSTAKPSTATQPGVKNKTSTVSSAASASPTVQDSFFKAVTKRLQHLETNTSLSLQYIEEQSRFLQEALAKMERRQVSRVDAFLDALNRTALGELRAARQQYDQIWQSTVLALEAQREQSQREVVALTGRLAVLADEVVFQRRMAILQSVLLLACMALVVFSRGLAVGGGTGGGSTSGFDLALHHARSPVLLPSPPTSTVDGGGGEASTGYSPSPSPVKSRTRPGAHILGNGGTGLASPSPSGSHGEKVLPLTPPSDYGRGEATPTIQVDDAEFFDSVSGFSPLEPAVEGDTSRLSTDIAKQGREVAANHPPYARAALVQPGTARKPLPALPEDPS